MSILVKNNIHWVGQRDWEVRDFHGTEYKTLRGSSYNSYLIREGKKRPDRYRRSQIQPRVRAESAQRNRSE